MSSEISVKGLTDAEKWVVALSMLESLSKKKALIFLARFYFGMTVKEIGDMFKIHHTTVCEHIDDARVALGRIKIDKSLIIQERLEEMRSGRE